MAAVVKPTEDKWQAYREFIDALVDDVEKGQGAIGPNRVRSGVWNRNATEGDMPDQYAINQLLSRMSGTDREVIALMLRNEFTSGVHSVLVQLHERNVPPCEDAYEGTPFHDFVGRLDGWEWPERPHE